MSFAGYPRIASAIDTLSNDFPFQTETRNNSDGTLYKVVRAYNGTGSAATANACYVLRYDGDEETNPSIVAASTSVTGTTAINYVVVATDAIAAASFGWYAIHGVYDVLVEGTTDVAKDDYLELVQSTSATALVKDGTSLTINSVAIACAAQAANSAVATRCFLFGERITLAAS